MLSKQCRAHLKEVDETDQDDSTDVEDLRQEGGFTTLPGVPG